MDQWRRAPFKTNENAGQWWWPTFAAWLPNTSQILTQVRIVDDNVTLASSLYLWNVASDEVRLFLPGGVWGDFSPDGGMLAAVTYSPTMEFKNEMGVPAPASIDLNAQPYLHLIRWHAGQVQMSAPVLMGKSEAAPRSSGEASLSFSPDSQYLVFVMPGPLALVVVSTRNGRLLAQAPLAKPDELFVWSPKSDRLAFMDAEGGLSMMDLRRHTVTVLAQKAGAQLSDPRWSFDGSYLSFRMQLGDFRFMTYILGPIQ